MNRAAMITAGGRVCTLALLLSGCGKDPWHWWPKGPGGGHGPNKDAAAPLEDAGSAVDAGVPLDAGGPEQDAGTPDPDAATPEPDGQAPAPDASEPVDAAPGEEDASSGDSGAPVVDAGPVDAGVADAGDPLAEALEREGTRADEARVELVLGAYCANVLRCEADDTPVASCVNDERAAYDEEYGGSSELCRDALLDTYSCIATSACEDVSTCSALFELLIELCAP